jgi:hypothetical protein
MYGYFVSGGFCEFGHLYRHDVCLNGPSGSKYMALVAEEKWSITNITVGETLPEQFEIVGLMSEFALLHHVPEHCGWPNT